jgi:hypothetical protein
VIETPEVGGRDSGIVSGVHAAISGRAAGELYTLLMPKWQATAVSRGYNVAELERAVEALRLAGAEWDRQRARAVSAKRNGGSQGEEQTKPEDLPSEWMSSKEAAEMLGTTERRIQQIAAHDRDHLLGSEKEGGHWRHVRSEVLSLLKSRGAR